MIRGFFVNSDGTAIFGRYWYRAYNKSYAIDSRLIGYRQSGYSIESVIRFAIENGLKMIEESEYREYYR